MIIRFLHTLYRKTLANVWFGIAMMVLVAIYLAIGSGLPGVREHFEMSNLQFFDAWPLKVLMGLLVASLTVVTLERIPFTPPRYGVWCVHAGIITLIAGMAIYYANKVEGLVRIPIGSTVDHFYDTTERAIYARIDREPAGVRLLPSLPRFHKYGAEFGNASYLDRPEMKNFRPTLLATNPQTGRTATLPADQLLGLKDKLTVTITGFWPYASIVTNYDVDPKGQDVGIHLTVAPAKKKPAATPAADAQGMDVNAGDPMATALQEVQEKKEQGPQQVWLVADDAPSRVRLVGQSELEIRRGDDADAEMIRAAAARIHKLSYAIAGADGKTETAGTPLYVQIGKTYPLGDSGYTVTVESYDPTWSMFDTHEIVRALIVKVHSPTVKNDFNRMILEGKDVQTDFIIGAAGAGPMGKRQKTPLDKNLVLKYQFDDPQHLMPVQGAQKHTLVAIDDGKDNKKVLDIVAGPMIATTIHDFKDGAGVIQIADTAGGAPFAPFAHQHDHDGQADGSDGQIMRAAAFTRENHVVVSRQVAPVPKNQQDKNIFNEGLSQVVRAKVSCGDWSTDIYAPYADDVMENPGWGGAAVKIPGTSSSIQLQLGKARWKLPAQITLSRFDLVPYSGGEVASQGTLFKDFRSTIEVTDPSTGQTHEDVVHLNHPVYYRNGAWLFFQAQWDAPDVQRGLPAQWTVLGVGNRPGMWIMTIGCIMIGVGLIYAFYVKPVIIRRMKLKALEKAAEQAAQRKAEKANRKDQEKELVSI